MTKHIMHYGLISVSNRKGGVGKTTSTANISAGLNLLNKKVLLIDLDSQANLTIHFGFTSEMDKTIYGALREEYKLPIYTKNRDWIRLNQFYINQ